MPRLILSIGCIVLLTGCAAALAADPLEPVRFNEDVRPILSNNCFYCHGPDPSRRQADLRLDVREGATADLGGSAAVVPGKPQESLLLERVTAADPDQRMPPLHSKKPPLEPEQIDVLRRWIEQGAPYEAHWAFQPIQQTAAPEAAEDSVEPGAEAMRTDAGAVVRNPIDHFIQARLARERIKPSAEADRATLIRRLSLDLLGLLPTPEQVHAFVNDPDPAAYEKLVDRLLASPHYGERWGRHWLDQARYADSNGYTIDSHRAMWPYRDWVIHALNTDMPFDQFTIEQLAGDLLPNPTKSQLVATAFHRNTLVNEEGGTDAEQFRHEAVVDRTNTTGAVWLGLTIGCAQCHTHKFDPITHREYYELFAFFNQAADANNKGPTITVSRGEMFGAELESSPEPTPAAEQLAEQQSVWEQKQLEQLAAADNQSVQWQPLRYLEYDTKTGAGFQLLEDGSLLSDGRGAFNDTYRILAETDLPQVSAVRLRVLTHESLPRGGPGRAKNGNFVLTDFRLHVDGQPQTFAAALADHEQPDYPVAAAIDGDAKSGWAINVAKGSPARLNADHEAVFVLSEPLAAPGRQLELTLFHDLNENYLIGRFALEVAKEAPSSTFYLPVELVEALRTPAPERSAEQAERVRAAFVEAQAAEVSGKGDEARSEKADLMIMKRVDTPRQTYVYQRGDFLRPDKAVGPLTPGTPGAILPELASSADLTRLDLADWLVDPRNPLPARVTMNRVWMRYFGRGLVETEEDFGTQGSGPTHPELLDWLAAELIRRQWSMKEMHRLIVTSATYRQSSTARAELQEKDPRNLLLARQERLRLEAEIVRDAALSASGLLSTQIGGPSVHPPQPDGVYAFTQTAKKWEADKGSDRYRRAVYTMFYRSAPYPLFTTFDTPDLQTVCTRRPRSNTPLQALTVANDEAFVELARGLARRVLEEQPADNSPAWLNRAFQLALCRSPSSEELAVVEEYYERQLAEFRKEQTRAEALIPAGSTPDEVPLESAAALTSVARVLLNTDNFITRE